MKKEKMALYNHKKSSLCRLDTGALAGLRHRTVLDAQTGAKDLALWQEEHLPRFYVPPHRHDCEEIIFVFEGKIRAEIEGEIFEVNPEESLLIHEWKLHGFRVISNIPVKLLAIFSSASPGIFKNDGTKSIPPWEGGISNHLEEI
jgi:mannose-6-phosphate isomerase-like protein (cupin superfamily)